jgi:hypothetical protein
MTGAACLAGRCCNNALHYRRAARLHDDDDGMGAQRAVTATAIAAFISPFTAAR